MRWMSCGGRWGTGSRAGTPAGRSRTDVRHDSGVVQGRSDRLAGLMDTSATLPQLDETLLATTRYLQALTLLDEESVRRPSLLRGWSRAHLVGHLSRNADAFERALTQAVSGERGSMYDAQATRDDDIEDTARTDLGRLPGRAGDVPAAHRRVPAPGRGGDPPRRPRPGIPSVGLAHRLLAADGRPAAGRAGAVAGGRSLHGAVLDRRRGPLEVRVRSRPGGQGSVGDLAWWLVGRGGGAGPECSSGRLPVLGPWR